MGGSGRQGWGLEPRGVAWAGLMVKSHGRLISLTNLLSRGRWGLKLVGLMI